MLLVELKNENTMIQTAEMLNPTKSIMNRVLSDKTSKESRLEAGYWERIKENDAAFSYRIEEWLAVSGETYSVIGFNNPVRSAQDPEKCLDDSRTCN